MACERWPGETLVVGFSTDHGTVSAASDWDAPVERKRVRPALEATPRTAVSVAAVDRASNVGPTTTVPLCRLR